MQVLVDIMERKELRSVTINSLIEILPRGTERWSEELDQGETMHIVALEHFIGVGKGGWSDNGHMLSKNPVNPWIEWKEKPTGMEPTGTEGYFGYCGRDYYTEVGGITDVNTYEAFPVGHHFLVGEGEKLYMHCYGSNFNERPVAFHHAVRVLFW
jgi:hypothetical protein